MGATAYAGASAQNQGHDDDVIELIPDLRAEELDARIRKADRRSEVGHRELAFYLAEMHERGLHQMLGYASAVEYACSRLEMSRRHAQELIAAGRALSGMPAIDEAFCNGRLRWSRIRLLVRIAVPSTERAWLERAVDMPWKAFDRLVATSEQGRAPRDDGKGTPKTRVVVRGRLDRVAYETWEMAKEKLAAERGERMTDADCIEYAGAMILGSRRGGPVEAREPIDDSIYRVIIQKCPTCEQSSIRTPEGPEEIDPRAAARIACDAPSESVEDDPGHEEKTPPALRRKVLNRDGRACVVCRGRRQLVVHHVVWLSRGGKTLPSNLTSLCAPCHGRVHDGLLVITGTAPHGLRITDRNGVALDEAAVVEGGKIVRNTATCRLKPAVQADGALGSQMPAKGSPTCEAGWGRSEVGAPAAGSTSENGERAAAKTAGECASQSPAHRPARLGDMIGQAGTVRALMVAAKAAKKRGAPVDHVLLLGGAGLGKTSLAAALAAEIGTGFHVANGAMLQDPEVLIGLLRNLGDRDVLFIDEIHAIPRRAMECLYEAMEDSRISLTATDGAGSAAVRVSLAPFTLVGATTEIGLLPDPFVSRFPIREHLAPYEPADLAAIVAGGAARDGGPRDDDPAPPHPAMSRGSPRHALGLFRRTRDEALAGDLARIDRGVVRQALEAAGYDEDGLVPIERRALEVLLRHGRPMGLARWAASSGLPAASLRTLCEPELLRQGLITVTPRGRMARAQLRAVFMTG
jgi:Holliday junction DNA helicase RuvB